MSEPAISPMGLGEFLVWREGQDGRYELVDGQPMAMGGARLKHDRISQNATLAIGPKLRGGPCRTCGPDVAVATTARQGRQPDFSVDCGPFDLESMVATEPRVVMEILSRSTRALDQFGKLDEYKAVASIRHIILVDPDAPEVILWSRAQDGIWSHVALRGPEAALALPAIGVEIQLGDLYDGLSFRPRPTSVPPPSIQSDAP